MTKAKYNPKIKDHLDSFLLALPGVTAGKMFGYPAYYVGKKLFACVYEDGVGIKVPENLANDLIKNEGITYFQPLGRPKMKQWIQIQINQGNSEDYYKYIEVFKVSIEFVTKSG
jgi:TfoX/Sxy family transcriptional regulator of competence genes